MFVLSTSEMWRSCPIIWAIYSNEIVRSNNRPHIDTLRLTFHFLFLVKSKIEIENFGKNLQIIYNDIMNWMKKRKPGKSKVYFIENPKKCFIKKYKGYFIVKSIAFLSKNQRPYHWKARCNFVEK